MKKTNNKGFSLVELIIVIAIMAILVGAIAPALIRYIDKSRKSNDVTSAKTIKTAVETALGNEDIYSYLTNTTATGDTAFSTVTITPGQTTSSSGSGTAVAISGCSTTGIEVSVANVDNLAKKEIGTNIGEKTPKLKYKKANTAADVCACVNVTPSKFYALVSKKGTVYVLIGSDTAPSTLPTDLSTYTAAYAICPETCGAYQ